MIFVERPESLMSFMEFLVKLDLKNLLEFDGNQKTC